MVAVHTGTSTSTLTKLTVLQEAVRVITDLENRLRGTGWLAAAECSVDGSRCGTGLSDRVRARVVHEPLLSCDPCQNWNPIGSVILIPQSGDSTELERPESDTHTYTVLTAIFQDQPVFPSPFVPPLRMVHCAFCWKRPKVFIS